MRFVTITYRVADVRATDFSRFYKISVGDDRTEDERLLGVAFCGILRVDVDSRLQKRLVDEKLKDLYKMAKASIRDYESMRKKEITEIALRIKSADKAMATAMATARKVGLGQITTAIKKPTTGRLNNNYEQLLML